jgi:hypothetical protein
MQFKNEGTTVTVPVPLHDTLQSIIRQSGLSKSLFESE